ncbi:glycosyltransferase family 2 protein [Constantimarinum furrinae]|uniref:Glycosyltransferase n=1 Tax=Constantimarinum furrinae TaxID=2562285 RepID=A0A7G8PXV0_9FLAO|nr:glycosyltransferase family 2 protein [Constantimarinum furrinae]QNJ99166.1 Putative glycosyltransferase [Constantimarinum furrinae]
MNIAVVILNWNGKELLSRFLPSVVNFSPEATIYVADNASTDDSVAFLSEHFPAVRILKNTTNGGYAKGYNDALQGLSEELFVLLNSDVEVSKNWLPPILTQFKTDPELAAAQPKVLDQQNKDHFEYAGAAGGFIDRLGYPYCRGRIFNSLEKDHGQFNDIREIFWASGACLIVRKDAFWKVGGFDEDYFAHQEEIDLCWRFQSVGNKVGYIGTSTVYHVGGATLASANPRKTFFNFRNSLLNLLKNKKGASVWGIIFLRLILDAVAAVQFLFQGKVKHFLAVMRAHLSFYLLIAKFLKKRKIHASGIKYFRTNSIVWNYFVRKERNFNEGY